MTMASVADQDARIGEPETKLAEPAEPSRWCSWRGGLRDALAALAVLMVVNFAAGPAGFWSADEAVSHQQVELLAEGSWTLAPPEPDIDPTGQWHSLSPISLGEGVAAPYVKHPLFPALVRTGDVVAGRIGRHLIPAIGSVLAAFLIAVGADRRRPGSARLSFWIAAFGTPLLFHGTTLWAHSLGIAAAAAASLLTQPLFDSDRFRGRGPATNGNRSALSHLLAITGFGVVAGLGVLLRSEAAIFFVLLGCCLGLFGLLGRRFLMVLVGVVAIAATLGAFLLDGVLRAAILGPAGDVALAVPPEPLFDLSVRGALTWTWLVGSRPDLGLGRIVGMILLAVAAMSARGGSRLNLSPALGLIGGALYLPALLTGSTMAVFPAAPALLVGLLLLDRLDGFTKMVLTLSALHFTAVVATSYANGGGGDWGGRYLALLLAPLAIVALPEIWHHGTSTAGAANSRSALNWPALTRPLFAGVVLASVALAAAMSINVVENRRNTGSLAEELAAEIAAEASPEDLVVSTDGRIGRLLGDTDVDARLLQVPGESMSELVAALPPGTEFVILDALQPFDVPDDWTVLAESENLIRVRP